MTRRIFFAMVRDVRASGSAEFALVLPILIIFLLGAVDVGRLMWVTNMAEKATQMGARYAIVTDILPPKLLAEDYVGTSFCGNLGTSVCTSGDLITSRTALGPLVCTSTSCTCGTGATCPAAAAMATGVFHNLVLHMKKYYPAVADANVTVTFNGSGLGYAGDPTGMDVVPLVTVGLTGLTYTPVSLFKFVSFGLPAFATTLSDESAVGQLSN